MPVALSLFAATIANAEIVTYAAPSGANLSTDYTVMVNGVRLDVYQIPALKSNGGNYSMTYFDFSGSVKIEIRSQKNLANAIIRPESYNISKRMNGDTLVVSLDKPRNISIEPDVRNGPLLIFGNPIEQDIPSKGDPGVIYYGPGIHQPDQIKVGDNQTLYIAGGAIIKAPVLLTGNNATIRGRGIIDGSPWGWRKGPTHYFVNLVGARNVRVRDIIIASSFEYTLVPDNCDSVTISNVKICGSKCQNDDGIQVWNCSDVLIEDCFIRTDDDCLCLYGKNWSLPMQRATIERCVLWCDRADIIRVGWWPSVTGIACDQSIMRDCDVIHSFQEGDNWGFWSYNVFGIEPSDGVLLSNMRFENIRINVDAQPFFTLTRIISFSRAASYPDLGNGQYGIVKNIHFKDITLTGVEKKIQILIWGKDAGHYVDNISFENVMQYGQCTQNTTPGVYIGKYATNIEFTCGSTAKDDFRLLLDSPARSLGSIPFDVSRAGRRTPATLTVGLPPVPKAFE